MANDEPVLSVMLAVPDAQVAARWYEAAVGATRLWDLGSVVGLSVRGAPLFLGEPAGNGWADPVSVGSPKVRIEVFVDDPDAFVARAVAAGADAGAHPLRDHDAPWGVHRQGGFVDPFGHLWFVGDRSPLLPSPTPGTRPTERGRGLRTADRALAENQRSAASLPLVALGPEAHARLMRTVITLAAALVLVAPFVILALRTTRWDPIGRGRGVGASVGPLTSRDPDADPRRARIDLAAARAHAGR